MIGETTAFTLEGIEARPVKVEVDVQRGLPAFQIIGLPDPAVRETRERVRAALVNSGYEFPLRRITANLAPADLRKVGPSLDLPIAVALLVAAGEISADVAAGTAFISELALDGSTRPVRGALAMAEAARAAGCHSIIVPAGNGAEAGLATGITVRTISNVSELRNFTRDGENGEAPQKIDLSVDYDSQPDLADLRGQRYLRRALEVAAAGGHGLLMVGPPGSGKSLAARRLPSILPPLSGDEVLEVARIAGACGVAGYRLASSRPFRAPHHTVSAAGLVGGGNPTRPGEVTLAHRGVLFLDELAEFRREALDQLKEPLETGKVAIARSHRQFTMPADIQLIAASNPCPCGRGEDDPRCECTPLAIRRYRSMLRGAITDRIDIHIAVGQPDAADMSGDPSESSAEVRKRVTAARERMTRRFGPGRTNANATPEEVAGFEIEPAARDLVNDDQFLTGRSIARVLKLARTLADLADRDEIREEDINQALAYTCRQQQCASA